MELVFEQAPRRVYWELTRACALACRHCRAEAMPSPDPRELGRGEGRRLLEALREFGRDAPRVVLTGGDPLRHPHFWDFVEHGTLLGLDLSVAPSATTALTPALVGRLRRAGIRAMSLSLDGSDAVRHDGLRGEEGCFASTLVAARAAVDVGLALQVNTLVAGETASDLAAIADLVGALGAQRWSLFFLVPVGRGGALRPLEPAEGEEILRWLWARSRTSPFVVSTTEAPQFRRVALEELRRARAREEIRRAPLRHGFGIRDGNGIMFVSHAGEVQPSGFLPLRAGHVRVSHPVEIYREAPLFRRLREPARFHGRCGRCEFRQICGGSRARAYAATGDVLGEDPLCAYAPPADRDAERACA
jgi:radical SAM protein